MSVFIKYGFDTTRKETEKKASAFRVEQKGTVGGALKYGGASLLAGIGGIGEGIADILVSAGAAVTGDTEYAKYRYMKSDVADWRQKVREEVHAGKVTDFVGDVAQGIGQSSVFLLDAVAPGLGTGLFFTGISAQGISGAAQETGKLGAKEIGYGLASGALEAVTEKVIGAGGQAAGALAGAVGGKAVKSAGKSIAKSSAKTLIWDIAKASAGEGAEEFAQEFADVGLKRLFQIDPDAEITGQTWKDAAYEGFVGAVSGGLMASPAIVAQHAGNRSRGQKIAASGRTDSTVRMAKTVADIQGARAGLIDAKLADAKAERAERKAAGDKATAGDRLSQVFFDGVARRERKQVNAFREALQSNLDVWESLTEKERGSSAGMALLGQMEVNTTMTRINEAVDDIFDGMTGMSDEELEPVRADIKELTGRDYTAQEIREDKDGVGRQVAAAALLENIKSEIDGVNEAAEQRRTAEEAQRTAQEDGKEDTGEQAQEARKAAEEPTRGAQEQKDERAGNASANGRSVSRKTGRQIRIKRVLTVDGSPVYETEGTELHPTERLSSSEINWSSQETADAVRQAERLKLGALEIERIIHHMEKGQQLSGVDFVQEYHRNYLRGKYAEKAPQASRIGSAAEEAYQMGQMAGQDAVRARTKPADAGRREAGRKLRDARAGTEQSERVKLPDGWKYNDLRTEKRKAVFKAADILSRATGLKVEFFASFERDGKRMRRNEKGEAVAAPNGWIDKSSGVMHIDINARGVDGMAVFALGHETAHFIARWNANGFRELGEFLFAQDGVDSEALIREKEADLRSWGRLDGKTADEAHAMAYEEVVCDLLSPALQDGQVLTELASEHKNLFNKVWDHIKGIIANIRSALAGIKAYTDGGRMVQEKLGGAMSEMETLFSAALDEASARFAESQVTEADARSESERMAAAEEARHREEMARIERKRAEEAAAEAAERKRLNDRQRAVREAQDRRDEARSVFDSVAVMQSQRAALRGAEAYRAEERRKADAEAGMSAIGRAVEETRQREADRQANRAAESGAQSMARAGEAYRQAEQNRRRQAEAGLAEIGRGVEETRRREEARRSEAEAGLSEIGRRVEETRRTNERTLKGKIEKFKEDARNGEAWSTDGMISELTGQTGSEAVTDFHEACRALHEAGLTDFTDMAQRESQVRAWAAVYGLTSEIDEADGNRLPAYWRLLEEKGHAHREIRDYLESDGVLGGNATFEDVGRWVADVLVRGKSPDTFVSEVLKGKDQYAIDAKKAEEARKAEKEAKERKKKEAAKKKEDERKEEEKKKEKAKREEKKKENAEKEGIQDFGEKIGDARKDLASAKKMLEGLATWTDREAEKFVVKEKIWKKPDYKALMAEGYDRVNLFLLKSIRDAVDVRPYYPGRINQYPENAKAEWKTRQREYYIEYVSDVMEYATNLCLSTKERLKQSSKEAFENYLVEKGWIEKETKTDAWTGAERVQYIKTRKAEGLNITDVMHEVDKSENRDQLDKRLAREADKKGFLKENGLPKGFDIVEVTESDSYGKAHPEEVGTFWIRKGYLIAGTGFKSYEEAAESIIESQKAKKKDGKGRFVAKQLEEVHRSGPDYRQGDTVDITGDDYLKEFGFRGGEFGNWVNQSERQTSLNYGYDALRDLARALGIKPESVSLGGQLAIAFGARGSGLAAAHYENLRKVINLTKMNGAGSLSHEWFHALDDYMAAKLGKNSGLLSAVSPRLYTPLAKVIDTMKWKEVQTERNEEAERKEAEKNEKRFRDAIESRLLTSQKPYAGEIADKMVQYVKDKGSTDEFWAGSRKLVESISDELKQKTGRVLAKETRDTFAGNMSWLERALRKKPETVKAKTDFYKNSEKFNDIFKGMEAREKGNYWACDEEMLARAFAVYCLDKLKGRNDYLNGHAESNVYIDLENQGVLRAYPVGEERTAINAAFDELFEDIRKKGWLEAAEAEEDGPDVWYDEAGRGTEQVASVDGDEVETSTVSDAQPVRKSVNGKAAQEARFGSIRMQLADMTAETVTTKAHREWLEKYRNEIRNRRTAGLALDALAERERQLKADGKLTAEEREAIAKERRIQNSMLLLQEGRIRKMETSATAETIVSQYRQRTEARQERAERRAEAAENKVQEEKQRTTDKLHEAAERADERLNREREVWQKRLEKERNRNEAWRDSYERGEQKRLTLQSIRRMNDMLRRPTRERNIPIELQPTVVAALESINSDVTNAESRIGELDAKIQAETMMQNPDLEKIAMWERAKENIAELGRAYEAQVTQMQTIYERIKQSRDPNVKLFYTPEMEEKINAAAAAVRGRSLNELSLEELREVRSCMRMLEHTLANYHKAFADERKQTIGELGTETMQEIRKVGGEHAKVPTALKEIFRFLWTNAKPAYAFEVIGSDTMNRLYANLEKGEDTWQRDRSEAEEYAKKIEDKYGYQKWNLDKAFECDTQRGKVKLTLNQIMTIYAYSKREQAVEHMTTGGFVFDSGIEVVEKNKAGIPIRYTINKQTAFQITLDDFRSIQRNLTDAQKSFVEDMMAYLSTDMARKGNEVSRVLYGIDLFNEKSYFPIKSAKQFLAEENRAKGDPQIKNKGMTKMVKPGANNPIILSDFTKIWSNHVEEMAVYHGLTLPMEDLVRVYNYNDANSDSVKAAIGDAYGPEAAQYVSQLLKEMNGGLTGDRSIGLPSRMLKGFKRGATMMSLSVIIQQPTSIIRAMAYIEPKYFNVTAVKDKAKLWEECKKWCPVASIKENGRFDVDLGSSAEHQFFGKEYGTAKEKAAALFKDEEYRADIFGAAPETADELAWVVLWDAAKKKAAAEGKTVGSDEYFKAASDIFQKAVRMTQVYESRLVRSQIMRSNDFGAKLMTAFAAEPTTSANMIAMSIIRAKRGNKAALKGIGYVTAAGILNAIAISAIYALRDEEKDKTYGEKYAAQLLPNIVSQLNPMEMLPITRDIVSLIEGYDVERADMSIVGDIIKGFKGLSSGSKTPYRKVEDLAGSIANCFGVPVKNLMRDVRGIYNTIGNAASGPDGTNAGAKYAIMEAFGKDVSDGEQLYDALMAGDKAHYKRVADRIGDESAVKSALRQALRRHDERISLAAEAKLKGDEDTDLQLRRQIEAEKHFEMDDISAAVAAEYNKMKKEEKKDEKTS